MKLPHKIILASSCTLLGIILIALAVIWRLGLLPLLLPAPGGFGSEHLKILEQTGQQPAGTAGLPGANSANPDNNGNEPGEVTLPESLKAGKSPLQQQIEARYITRLQRIAGGYEGRLNSLVGRAWNEYSTTFNSGGKASAAALARKYIAAGTSLESQCDAQFYAVIGEFEAELRKNSLSLDTPKLARREYERTKAARKKQLLSTALQQL